MKESSDEKALKSAKKEGLDKYKKRLITVGLKRR
jgi:hypothetical protein